MAPTKDKDKRKKAKKAKNVQDTEPKLPDVLNKVSETSLENAREFDLVNDINDEFYNKAERIVQALMEINRLFEATKIKRYVVLINRIHRRYVDQIKENEEMRPKIEGSEMKLRLALELTEHSENCMSRLRDTLAEVWKKMDDLNQRDQIMQENMQKMFLKCQEHDFKESQKTDEDNDMGPLAKYKNIILRERDRLNNELTEMEKRLEMQRFYSDSLEYKNKSNEDNAIKANARMNRIEHENLNQMRKIKNLTLNLEESKDAQAKTAYRLEVATKDLEETQHQLSTKTTEYDRLRILNDKLRSENNVNFRAAKKNEEIIKSLKKEQKQNEETIKSMLLEDQVKTNTINELYKKNKKVMDDMNLMSTKIYQTNRQNQKLTEEIVRLRNQINALEKSLTIAGNKYEELRMIKDSIQRERDLWRSDVIKVNNALIDVKHTNFLNNMTIDGLHLDIQKLNVKLDEAKISVAKAEKERDEMAQDVQIMHQRIEYLQDVITIKGEQVTNLTENLQQERTVLVNIKKQLEVAHSDKMMLKRSLETCIQERDDLRNKSTITAHQILQFTNEINANLISISNLKLQIERLNSEKKELQSDLKNTENILAAVRTDLKEMRNKNENLIKTLNADERKFIKMSTELEEVRKQRNLIGLQMVRRNDEIVLVKEKMIVMQNSIDNGTTQYNQRVEDIHLLKLEITNLQRERDCLSRAIKSTADMRSEVLRLHRQLNQERIRSRALMEDIKTPTGVHRWRILKGEDPHKFQLLQKLQKLQKRNLRQNAEARNLQQSLKQANATILSLKHIVENLPERNVKQKLVETQRINRSQRKKLKSVMAELEICNFELKSQQCDITDCKTKLNNFQLLARKSMRRTTYLSRRTLSQSIATIQQTTMPIQPMFDIQLPAQQYLHDTGAFTESENSLLSICKKEGNSSGSI